MPLEAPKPVPDTSSGQEHKVLDVIDESLVVDRVLETTGRIRVRITREAESHAINVEDKASRVDVERRERNLEVEVRQAPYYDGDVLVIPVYEEVVVTSRRWMLREEVRLRTVTVSAGRREEVVLRKDRVIIERLQPDGSWSQTPGNS